MKCQHNLVDRKHPNTGLEGKFSFHQSMAVGLVDGAAFPAQYTDDRVKDKTITALRDKITAKVDPSQVEGSAIVTLTLKDGRSYTETIPHATGTPENPLTDAQLDAKFRALAGEVMSRERVERALSRLWDMENMNDIRELFPLLRMTRRISSKA